MKRWLPAALAALIGAGAVALHHRRFDDPHIVYDRFNLPGFDAYAYVAMAENPGVFTLAPWGYRVLQPWLAYALPLGPVNALRWITDASLAACCALLFVFLRRVGHGALVSLLAVAAFSLSTPAAEAVRFPFLGDPLALALALAFLASMESGAGLGVLALLAACGALAKELAFFCLPAYFALEWSRRGARSAAFRTAAVATPALLIAFVLRTWWTPHIVTHGPAADPSSLTAALDWTLRSWRRWAPEYLLFGVTPVALLAMLRAPARPYLVRYGYLVVFTLTVPLVAAVYPGEAKVITFFAADVPRLLLYTLPFLLGLALFAIQGLLPRRLAASVRAAPPAAWPRTVDAGAWLALAALFAAASTGLDRYRRLDLQGSRDGPYVATFCRESLRAARRLERGDTVVFDAETHQHVWGESDPGTMNRMRWFLWHGWGEKPHYSTGPIIMRESRASIVLPMLIAREVEVTLDLEAEAAERFTSAVNGSPVQGFALGATRRPVTLRVDATALRRGDNLLVLESPSGVSLRLHAMRLRRIG